MIASFEFDISEQETFEGLRPTVKWSFMHQNKLLSDKGKVKDQDLQYFKWTDDFPSAENKLKILSNPDILMTKRTCDATKFIYQNKRFRANSHSLCRKQLNKLDSSEILEKLISSVNELQKFKVFPVDSTKTNKNALKRIILH